MNAMIWTFTGVLTGINLNIQGEAMLRAIQEDITKVTGFTAIVNPANNSLLGGGGVNGAIQRAAGPQLKTECRRLNGCETGDSILTLGYNLSCKYVIHSVGPVWNGGFSGEEDLLISCYNSALKIALHEGIRTIAIPSISTGEYGYPVDEAAKIAVSTVSAFMEKHPDAFDDICFVLQDEHQTALYLEEIKEYEPKKAAPKKAPGRKKTKKGEADIADHEVLTVEENQDNGYAENPGITDRLDDSNSDNKGNSTAQNWTSDSMANAAAANDSALNGGGAAKDSSAISEGKDDVAGSSYEASASGVSANKLQNTGADGNGAEADTGKESEGTYNLPSIPVSLDMPDIQGLWNRYTIDKLIEQVHEAIINIYVCFGGDAASEIFSLEYAKNPLYVNGRKYVSVIQYMMSEKALLFGDINSYANILNESDPQTLLELGDKIVGADAEVWSKVFREVLFRGNVAKCLSDEEFKSTLLETGNCVLINADVDDDFYGAGVSKDKLVDGSGLLILEPDMWHKDGSDKQAENILGFVLMGVREYFMKTGM